MAGVMVRVLVAGAYSSPSFRAVPAKAGDLIEIADGWYSESVIFDGLVEPIHQQVAEISEEDVAFAAQIDAAILAQTEQIDTEIAEAEPKPKSRGRPRSS